MQDISVTPSGDRLIVVKTPYHPLFLKVARALNAEHDGQDDAWVFDSRDETRVRQALVDVFGTDGSGEVELATARVKLIGPINAKAYFAFGRRVAIRWRRDDPVKLGQGVVIVEGEFPEWGGSARAPDLLPKGQVVVEVRDAPKFLVLREMAQHPDRVSMIDDDTPGGIKILLVHLEPATAEILATLTLRHIALSQTEIIAAALNMYEMQSRPAEWQR